MDKCPIWGTPASVTTKAKGNKDVESDRAGGSYSVTGSAIAEIQSLDTTEKVKLTTWLVNQRLLGDERPTIDAPVAKKIHEFRGLRVGERLDRVLQWRERQGDKLGDRFPMGGVQNEETARNWELLHAWGACGHKSEAQWLLKQSVDGGFLDRYGDGHALALKGWQRLEQLRSLSVASSQAFVAMWFADDMEAAYAGGFEPGIRDAGYKPLRIDQKDHINRIDDEIIAEIRRSRFVVADFTSEPDRPRGGVYFEAGFAYGLNLPVIWTCRKDLIDHVHFDTRQFNHIVWSEPDELRTRLRNRIAAAVGDGPERSSD